MMSLEHTSRRRIGRLRQVRTRAAIVEYRGKYPGLQAAWKTLVCGCINKTGIGEGRDDGSLVLVGESGSMGDAGLGVEERVKSLPL